jgi:hypothetical protein
MDQILPTIFRFRLSCFRYRPNKNLYEWKWWEDFSVRFWPFLPLVLASSIYHYKLRFVFNNECNYQDSKSRLSERVREKKKLNKHIWETKWSVPWFDCDESLTWEGLNLNPAYFDYCFNFILCFVGELCLLVSRCAGGRCDMACSDEDRGRSRRPGAEDQGWSHRLGTRWPGDRDVRWHRVRSAPWKWRREARVSWLSLKTKVVGLASKSVATDFLVWVSKLAAPVWWFGRQNHHGDFLVWASKPNRRRFVSCATKLMEGGRHGTHIEIWRIASPGGKSC